MTTSKNVKRQRAELLGMPVGTAEKKLRKSIIHELAMQAGKDTCCHCGSAISSPDDLAIVHVQDWEDDPDQFWDLTNIAFSHASCQATRSGKRQKEQQSKMSRVDIKIEDHQGNPLPGVRHEGNLYIAGKKNQRYQIKVRNKTGKRVLVITTVDGRNVITGKPGGDGAGHVLEAYQTWEFKGWRTSDDDVAAFCFGKKANSYSAQMGSPENVGVIGVAVFEEKEPEKPIITIKEKEYVPFPYVVPSNPWPRPWPGPYQPYWGDFTVGGSFGGGGGTYTASAPMTFGSEVTCSTHDSAPFQQIGTEFGEQLTNRVGHTSFIRATEDPAELWTLYYDTKDALEERGIKVQRPSQDREKKPQAFPGRPEWQEGHYCTPPPRRRSYKR